MALLKKFKTDYGTISVMRDQRDGSMAYVQNGCYHSQSTKDGISLCVYVHVIEDIIQQMHARNILVIGCAGGTLATMLRRLHCRVTVVDINPFAFAIARRYFQLPEDVRCIRRDGIAYLRTTQKHYDAVVVDVFGSNNNVPPVFTSEDFFASVKSVLNPSGLMIMNTITAHDHDQRADHIAHRAQAAGLGITMFDWPHHKDRNTLLVSGLHKHIVIPSGREPGWIRPDLRGMIRRKPKKRTFL